MVIGSGARGHFHPGDKVTFSIMWTDIKFASMAVKHEQNLVGSLMFVVFLMGAVLQYFKDALSSMIGKGSAKDYVEMLLMFPLSLGMLGFLGWVFFDSSWLNFDDEEKERELKTSRWVKFSVLFLLPSVKLMSSYTWKDPTATNLMDWGTEVANQIKCFLVILLAYFSLCVSYRSGLGRLFQPFTVPRSKIYTDEKGQKFEVNFIGTTLSILLIVFPCWYSSTVPIGRLFLILSGNSDKMVSVTAPYSGRYLSDSADGRAICDGVIMLFVLYSFIVTFASCVKVTFFLKGNFNYMKFAPIPLTPLAILFCDQLCSFGIEKSYGAQDWIFVACYVMVSFVAYVSLVSPPDSLTAVLFQPHIPMINIVTDLPEMAEVEKPRTTAVFPDNSKSTSDEVVAK